MKRILLILFTTILMWNFAVGQSAENYSFNYATNGSLTDMSSGTTQLITSTGTSDIASSVTNIGFTFPFMGSNYSQFSVNNNGLLRLGNTIVGNTWNNDLNTTSNLPLITAFWDDFNSSSTSNTTKVHYKLTGSSPNQILTIEWKDVILCYNASTSGGGSTFQIRLHENGTIEFVYGTMEIQGGTVTASIGFSVGNANNSLLSVTDISTPTITTLASNVNDNLVNSSTLGEISELSSSADGSRVIYTFTPVDATSTIEAPASQIAAGDINSTVTTSLAAQSVFNFKIKDYGNTDGISTDVTTIKIKNNGSTADWTNTIQGALLFDGATELSTLSTIITDDDITFTLDNSELNIADNNNKDITLKIYLNTSNIVDNSTLKFIVPQTSHDFTSEGSQFTSDFGADVLSNTTTIRVTATKLIFATNEPPSNVFLDSDFTVTANAVDANGNIDTDKTNSITLSLNTGTGTLSSVTGLTQNLVSGTYTWNDVKYNTEETFRLQCSTTGLTTIISGNINVLVQFCGDYHIGIGNKYETITDAVNALNLVGITCATTFYLDDATYPSETFPITFNSISGASSSNTITFKPNSSASPTISGNNATSIFIFDNADYIIFDGSNITDGNTKDLTIENSNTSGATMILQNDATYNIFKNCNIKGTTTSAGSGVLVFSTSNQTVGNIYNTIDNCDIADGISTPAVCIYSKGTSGKRNDYNTIKDCNIYNFYNPSGSNYGIYIDSYDSDWTIDNNKFYQTASRTYTSNATHFGIYASAGNNISIKNNIIGYANSSQTGTYTMSSNSLVNFVGIYMYVGSSITSTCQNNTITNFSLTTASSAAGGNGVWCGIDMVGGQINCLENTIGSTTENDKINITSTGSGSEIIGIRCAIYSAVTININSNNIGGITTGGDAAIGYLITCIKSDSGSTPSINISENTIGSESVANNIKSGQQSITTSSCHIVGIRNYTDGVVNINSNKICNLTAYGTNASSPDGQILGIDNYNSGQTTISKNLIYNLTQFDKNLGTADNSSVIGISQYQTSSSNQSVYGNEIYSLKNSSSLGTVSLIGIYTYNSSTSTNSYYNNFIHNLETISSDASNIIGIYVDAGKATYYNNMISLGMDISGTTLGNSNIIGIEHNSSVENWFYFNSVYIGGTVTGNTDTKSFVRSSFGEITLQNNIFQNSRSRTSGTGKHYAVYLNNNTDVATDYNIYYANGTGTVLASINTTDITNIQDLREAYLTFDQDLHSAIGNPNFVLPAGSSETTDLHLATNTPCEAAGITVSGITIDFDESERETQSPTDIGADAGNFTQVADIFTPNISYTPFGTGVLSGCNGTGTRILNAVLTDMVSGIDLSNPPMLYYKKNAGGTWVSSAGTLTSGNQFNGTWQFTIDYTNVGGVTATDNIFYYVVAQDITGNIWYTPFVDASHSNVSTQISAPSNTNSYDFSGTSAMYGTYTVGAGADYSTLTGVGGFFNAINNSIISGNITANITSDITESGTVALNQQIFDEGCGTNFSVLIQPDATTMRTLSATGLSVSMIDLNGADRVTFDGKTGKYLTLRNTHSTASNCRSTIELDNGAQNCIITNCIIENNTSGTSYANILFGNSGTNQFNTISNCEIKNSIADNIGNPKQAIYSYNSSNSNNTITENNIYNWITYGVRLYSIGDNWNINGNSLYQTNSVSVTQTAISVKAGNNHTIDGNYIGGTAPQCAGTHYINTGNVYFTGIDLTPGTSEPTNVINNIIQNIDMQGTDLGTACIGISASSGRVNVGTTTGTGNIIGHPTIAQSIKIAATISSPFANASFIGIYVGYDGNFESTINYNEVANIYSTSERETYCINVSGTYPVELSNNTVHDVTVVGTGTDASLFGIYVNDDNNSTTFLRTTNNTVYNLSCSSTNTSEGTSSALIGICLKKSGANNQIISNNLVYNLTGATTTSSATHVLGFYLSSPASTASVSKNRIYNLQNKATGGYLAGIRIFTGDEYTFSNNMISIDNSTNNNPVNIRGIWEDSGILEGLKEYFYNSVYIAGTATSGNANSYAFLRTEDTYISLKNNIFCNERTGGTGSHYAIGNIFSTPEDGWNAIASNYNDFYTATTVVGEWGNGINKTFAEWQIITDANSLNVQPIFTSSIDLHLVAGSNCSINGMGTPISITDDYDSETRHSSTPDIGADEFDGTGTGIATWTGTTDTDWNTATNWQCNQMPSATIHALIPDVSSTSNNFPIINDIEMESNNLTVDANSSLEISAANSLTVYGSLLQNGTLTLKSPANMTASASLITLGEISGTGTNVVERYFDNTIHYISIPFETEDRANLPGTYLYSYNETVNDTWDAETISETNGWTKIESGNITKNTGYAFYNGTSETVTLSQTNPLNTGNQSTVLSRSFLAGGIFDGWNMIGNPYPSSIDWEEVTIPSGMESAIYYYDDVTSSEPNQSNYRYFVPSTGTGGTYGVGLNTGSQYIPPMQGFFVRATSNNTTLELTNNERCHSTSDYYKENKETPNLLVLRANANGISDETAIRIVENATFGHDAMYDALKMYSYSSLVPQIYSFTDDEIAQAINSVPDFDNSIIIPIGFAIQTSGDYSIEIEQFTFENKIVYLKDKLENQTIDLSVEPIYYFSINSGVTNDRFEIIIENENHAPEIENQEFFVEENSTNNSLQIVANDIDNDDLIYSIISGNNDDIFTINENSGDITINTSLNYEENSTYQLEVSVFDGFNTDNSIININVIDINESPIAVEIIDNQKIYVNEEYVFQFSEDLFFDEDYNDELNYSAYENSTGILPNWLFFNSLTRTFEGTPISVNNFEISVLATDLAGNSAETSFSLEVKELNIIKENQQNNFKIYPNPNNGICKIKLNVTNFENSKYEVYDILGNLKNKGNIRNQETEIHFNESEKGIFFIKIYTEKEQFIEKVIIK